MGDSPCDETGNFLRRCCCDFTQHVEHPLAIRRIGIHTLRTWMRTVEHFSIWKFLNDRVASVLRFTPHEDDCAWFGTNFSRFFLAQSLCRSETGQELDFARHRAV